MAIYVGYWLYNHITLGPIIATNILWLDTVLFIPVLLYLLWELTESKS
jgi:hypothetical protein